MGPVMGSGDAPIIVEAEARAVESAIAPAVDQVDQAALGQVPPMVREEDQVDQESLLTDSQTIAKDPEAALPVQVTGEVEEVAPSAGSEPQLDLSAPLVAMEVGVPSDAENPAPVQIPSLGPDQDIPSAGTDSGLARVARWMRCMGVWMLAYQSVGCRSRCSMAQSLRLFLL